MAAALAVIGHAPTAARPVLQSSAFSAFGSGLQVACIAGAGVAVLGAGLVFRLLPSRPERPDAITMPARAAATELVSEPMTA